MQIPSTELCIVLDWFAFIGVGLSVLYIAFFSLASLRNKRYYYPKPTRQRRFLLIVPAYAEDRVIIDSAQRLCELYYPKELFQVTVVSDHCSNATNEALNALPLQNLIATYTDSSKAKALQLAMESQTQVFDAVVILDADNMVEPDFLARLNAVCEYRFTAIQCHRLATPSRQSPVARLDAISEEINNSIFRRAHINMGLSSALIGSGMCFEYDWFKENVHKLSTAGEDKELEQLLLFRQCHIHYVDDLYVYDEKVKRSGNFQNQRRRWMAAQWCALHAMCKQLPQALHPLNVDYIDKTMQQAILPRILNLFLLGLFAIGTTLACPSHCFKWWILLGIFLVSLYIAVPRYYKNRDTVHALLQLPKLVLITLLNLFHLKGAAQKFIHTQHGE